MHVHTKCMHDSPVYFILVSIIKKIIVLQYALMELFGWWEEHHLIKANWSTVTMEHGLLFVTLLMMKRLQ